MRRNRRFLKKIEVDATPAVKQPAQAPELRPATPPGSAHPVRPDWFIPTEPEYETETEKEENEEQNRLFKIKFAPVPLVQEQENSDKSVSTDTSSFTSLNNRRSRMQPSRQPDSWRSPIPESRPWTPPSNQITRSILKTSGTTAGTTPSQRGTQSATSTTSTQGPPAAQRPQRAAKLKVDSYRDHRAYHRKLGTMPAQ